MKLSAPSTRTVLAYRTADVTATAGADYQATDMSVSFAPGETVKTIANPILSDTIPEGDETFTVTLSAPENATLSNATAVVTIVNDDPPELPRQRWVTEVELLTADLSRTSLIRGRRMNIIDVGAFCFGLVVGWVTSRTLRRSTAGGLSDIATVIGAIGGAAITGIYKPSTNAFGYYAIGLSIGFFLYLILAIMIAKKEGTRVSDWLGSDPPSVIPRGRGGEGGGGGTPNPGVLPPV